MRLPSADPSARPSVDLDEVTAVGQGLTRPECVLAHADGHLFVADWRGAGGVAILRADGGIVRVEAQGPEWSETTPLRPNGIALLPGGAFLCAHLGAEAGGVFRLGADGVVTPVLREVAGVALPPTNFVLIDPGGGLWVTVSTRKTPRDLGYRAEGGDGFIVRVDGLGARIVADGLGYANECALTADGRHLLVNETFARRLTRFAIAPNGDLVDRRTVATFGAGTYPDGVCLDEAGHAWVTSIVSNRLLRVAPDGQTTLILEDADADHVDQVEAAYRAGTLGRPHLDKVVSRRLRNLSSMAFGGSGRTTGFLGCLLGDSLHRVDTGVTGLAPVHWRLPLDELRHAGVLTG
jgi:sugar lactone lactonase YvrE